MPRQSLFFGLLASSGACLLLTPVARGGSPSTENRGVRAVFATQGEAEAAAARFGCNGAHRMGSLWMPCASHGEASGSSQPLPHPQ